MVGSNGAVRRCGAADRLAQRRGNLAQLSCPPAAHLHFAFQQQCRRSAAPAPPCAAPAWAAAPRRSAGAPPWPAVSRGDRRSAGGGSKRCGVVVESSNVQEPTASRIARARLPGHCVLLGTMQSAEERPALAAKRHPPPPPPPASLRLPHTADSPSAYLCLRYCRLCPLACLTKTISLHPQAPQPRRAARTWRPWRPRAARTWVLRAPPRLRSACWPTPSACGLNTRSKPLARACRRGPVRRRC
jgi:hypothetical protein